MHSYETLNSLPQNCKIALDRACAAERRTPHHSEEIAAAYIVGSGEAALAARLMVNVLGPTAGVPVVEGQCRERMRPLPSTESGGVRHLPAFVTADTLVVVLSADGSDPGLVAIAGDAADMGARIVAASLPGHLTDMAESQSFPFALIPESLDASVPMLGEIFFTAWGLLSTLSNAGSVQPASGVADAAGAIAWMTRQRGVFGPEARVDANPARLLTTVMRGKMPLIYGTTQTAAVAAAVWTDRLRRAGMPAVAGDIGIDAGAEGWPATVGGDTPHAFARGGPKIEALILRESGDGADHLIAQLRGALSPANCNELVLDGRTPLERLWGAIYLAEWTAFYLAA